MSLNGDMLAIVPVRGGSKSIPRKGMQAVDGKPLVLRTLDMLRKVQPAFGKIVVSSDDLEVLSFATLRGFEVLPRPAELADDKTPLIAVARHAVQALSWTGPVGIFQCTCPLVKVGTVTQALRRFRQSSAGWAIAAAPYDHILWREGHPIVPRVNRQQQDGVLVESGAFQLMTAEYTVQGIGREVTLDIPADEALDIDTWDELEAARRSLGRRRILFQITAGKAVGSGHFWRAVRLAEALGHHDIAICGHQPLPSWVDDELRRRSIPRTVGPPDLVCFDVLGVPYEQVLTVRAKGVPVIVFEDTGSGSDMANLVVNELVADGRTRARSGPDWTVLRSEFLALPPHYLSVDLQRVFVTFGGTDPAHLNARVSSLLALGGFDVRVAVGPGADEFGIKGTLLRECNMAEEMMAADLVITGQGRTQYEAAACGAPTVTIAANERESRHLRVPGAIPLGLHVRVTDEQLSHTVQRLADPELRQEMGTTARYASDWRGVDRIVFEVEHLLAGL